MNEDEKERQEREADEVFAALWAEHKVTAIGAVLLLLGICKVVSLLI